MKANREAVKTLAIAVGVREAARQLGIPEATVQSWSARGKWFKQPDLPPTIANPRNATIATTQPSDALATVLKEHKEKTKLGFSKAALKVAEAQSELPVEALRMPKEALVAKSWADVASKSQGWDEGKQEQGVLGGLQVYSEQTVIQVGQHPVNESSSA